MSVDEAIAEMKALEASDRKERRDEEVRAALIEVAKAERWAQVPQGTTQTLAVALGLVEGAA